MEGFCCAPRSTFTTESHHRIAAHSIIHFSLPAAQFPLLQHVTLLLLHNAELKLVVPLLFSVFKLKYLPVRTLMGTDKWKRTIN